MATTERVLPVVMEFTRLLNHWKAFERLGHDLAGEHLTSGELQTLRVVAECPSNNTTELAEQLGITNGAISQSVTKLVKRGFLERYRAPNDERSTFTRLTKTGSVIYQAHMKMYAAELSSFETTLAEASPAQVEFMVDFVRRVTHFFRDHANAVGR